MVDFVRDTMTGTNWTSITSRTGELGATWTTHGTYSGLWRLFGGRAYCEVPGIVYASGIPASADYVVECDYYMASDVAAIGIAGRIQTGSNTAYYTYYNGGELVLAKVVSGAITSLNAIPGGIMSVGNTYRLKLSMIGTTIKSIVNGVEYISVTDSSITLAGRAGLRSPASNDANVDRKSVV